MAKPRANPETPEERRQRMRRMALLRYATVSNPVGCNGHELINKGLDFTALPASDVCPFPPGSIEKVEWMRERVSRCEQTDNPKDCDSFESVAAVINHRSYPTHSKSPLGKVAEYIYHDPLTPGDEVWLNGDI